MSAIQGYPDRIRALYRLYSGPGHGLADRGKPIAMIGDGSISAGMACEALHGTDHKDRRMIRHPERHCSAM
ncbi:MAG: hypothetical protein GDA36_00510 [Rhodobacteraceae bacterium]|nr:hypothetical protein [Paracoccaceae bacterium]